MLLSHQTGLQYQQCYPSIMDSLLPMPLEIQAPHCVVVHDDYFVEGILHYQFAARHHHSEWFDGVTLDEVRDEANNWATFTPAAYINLHNPNAAAVLAIMAANDGKGLGTSSGKGIKRPRRLSEAGPGSSPGSHDYDSYEDEEL